MIVVGSHGKGRLKRLRAGLGERARGAPRAVPGARRPRATTDPRVASYRPRAARTVRATSSRWCVPSWIALRPDPVDAQLERRRATPIRPSRRRDRGSSSSASASAAAGELARPTTAGILAVVVALRRARVRIHPPERRPVLGRRSSRSGESVDQEDVAGVARVLERRPAAGRRAGAQQRVEVLAGQAARQRRAVLRRAKPRTVVGHVRRGRSRRRRSRTPGRSSRAPGAPSPSSVRSRAPYTRFGGRSPASTARAAFARDHGHAGAGRRGRAPDVRAAAPCAARRAAAGGPRARVRTRRARPRRSSRPRARRRAPPRRRPVRARCSRAPRSGSSARAARVDEVAGRVRERDVQAHDVATRRAARRGRRSSPGSPVSWRVWCSTCIPKPAARRATAWPMRPKPTSPSVAPCTSRPRYCVIPQPGHAPGAQVGLGVVREARRGEDQQEREVGGRLVEHARACCTPRCRARSPRRRRCCRSRPRRSRRRAAARRAGLEHLAVDAVGEQAHDRVDARRRPRRARRG